MFETFGPLDLGRFPHPTAADTIDRSPRCHLTLIRHSRLHVPTEATAASSNLAVDSFPVKV